MCCRVLVVTVLRVVEQDVGVVRDVVAADPLVGLVDEMAADRGLVVREVDEHRAVLLDAVRHGGPWCVTLAARTVADPIVTDFSGAS